MLMQQNSNIIRTYELSLDMWLSPSICVILGERQFVALLIRTWEKNKCLNMQIPCECPSWNGKLHGTQHSWSWVWIRLGDFFVIPFFFAIALFVYLFSFLYLFFFLFFFSIIFLHFFIVSKFIANVRCKKIRNVSKTSPSLAVSVFEFITPLSTFPSLDVSV